MNLREKAGSLALLLLLLSISSFGQKQSLKLAIKHYESKNLAQAEKEIDKASKSSFTSNEEVSKTMYYFFLINSEIYNSAEDLRGNTGKINEMTDAFKQCKKYDSENLYIPILEDKVLQMSVVILQAADFYFKNEDYSNYFKLMDYQTAFTEMIGVDNGKIYFDLAKDATKLALTQRAVVYWYKAIQADYEKETAYSELITALYLTKDYAQVDDFLKQAKNEFPNSNAFVEVEIRRFIDKELNFSALKLANQFIENDSSNAEILYLHGLLNANLNEHDIALNSFLKVLKLKPDHFKTQLELGRHYFKFAKEEGNLKLAKQHLEKAYLLDSKDEMTRNLLHDVYVELGYVQEAVKLLADDQ